MYNKLGVTNTEDSMREVKGQLLLIIFLILPYFLLY
jgi:hypothetical protein